MQVNKNTRQMHQGDFGLLRIYNNVHLCHYHESANPVLHILMLRDFNGRSPSDTESHDLERSKISYEILVCFTDQVCHDDCVDHCGCVLGAEYKLKAARRLTTCRVVTVTCQGHHTVTGS